MRIHEAMTIIFGYSFIDHYRKQLSKTISWHYKRRKYGSVEKLLKNRGLNDLKIEDMENTEVLYKKGVFVPI